MKISKLLLVTVILLCLFQLKYEAKSFPLDSAHRYMKILAIANINDDLVNDTIIGAGTHYNRIFPKYILWGNDTTVHPDPMTYPKVDTSIIIYPPWQDFRCIVNFDYMNTDSIVDMVFYMSGKVPQGPAMVDTAKIVAVFGQCGLDTIPIINLHLASQTEQGLPIYVKHIKPGENIVDCNKTIDNSLPYYRLLQVDDQLPPSIHHPEPVKITHIGDYDIEIYPNPAKELVIIDFKNIKTHDYTITLTNSLGVLIYSENIFINSMHHQHELSLKDFPTGTYVISIAYHNKPIHSTKLIISK